MTTAATVTKTCSFLLLFFLSAMPMEANTLTSETDNSSSSTPAIVITTFDIVKEGNYTAENTTETSSSVRSDPYAIIHQGSMSEAQYQICSLIINVILKPTVSLGGAILNVIGFCVLLQKQFRRSTYTYLCILALSDFFILLCAFLRFIPKLVSFYDEVISNYINMLMYPYVNLFFASVVTRISEYIICVLAFERLVAVMNPLKVKDLFLCRHAFGVCSGICVFCTLVHAHILFIYYPKPYFNPSRNITMYVLGRTSWYYELGIEPVYSVIYEIIFFYLPVIFLVICNFCILFRVRQMTKERRGIVASGEKKSDKMSNDQKRITLTLMIISFSFVSVFFPMVTLKTIQKFKKDLKLFGREHFLLLVVADIINLGWNMSSANDVIVYIYTSKQFKDSLVNMLCGRKGRKAKLQSQGPFYIDSQISTGQTEAYSQGAGLQT